MKGNRKVFLTSGTLIALSAILIGTSWADSLSQKKQQLADAQQKAQQLKSQADQTAQKIQQQKHKTTVLKHSLQQTQSKLAQTKQKIDVNAQQQQQLQDKIDGLNQKIGQTQKDLNKDTDDVNKMLRASYEYGSVPYVSVIFQSNSFSDLLSRLNLISMVTKSEKDLVAQVEALQKKLKQQKAQQDAAIHQLQQKANQLFQMKQTEVSLQQQKQRSITLVSRNVNALQHEENQYSKQMHLTQTQIKQLRKEITIQEEIANSHANVPRIVESNLRYHYVTPQKLYDYVQYYDQKVSRYHSKSALTLSDIQIICQNAQEWDVNPVLLVSITGAEESFDPAAWSASQTIRKNPFNVYYSWMWTAQYRPSWTLHDTAWIAAKTVRYKLSVPPPSGMSPFVWMTYPGNPYGVYATAWQRWSNSVTYFYNSMTKYVNS